MKILVLAPSFAPAFKAGGPARALTNLVRQASRKHDVTVVTQDRDLGDTRPYRHLSGHVVTHGAARIYYVNFSSPIQRLSIGRVLSRERYDLTLLNSMWNRSLSFEPAAFKLLGGIKSTHVAFMPRGELEAGALALKSGKKSIAFPLVRGIYTSASTCAVATSESELSNLRRYFPNLPAYLSSDVVDELDPGYLLRHGGPLRVLFIARVHPTKGLLQLLRALALVDMPIDLQVVGPLDDEEYWEECGRVAARLPACVRVNYVGPVSREGVRSLYESSDLMVSLTAGENFGHTIAESLQVGCPVMVTTETLWTKTIIAGGGVVVSRRDDATVVGRHLTEWAAMDDEELIRRRALSVGSFAQWQEQQPPDVVELIAGLMIDESAARLGRS